VSSPDAIGDYQGVSAKKWDALQMPSSLVGQSVLDIGCSEGYFAQRCAERGAAPVVGIDGSLGRLLAARFLSQRDGLNVRYRMGLFPGSRIRGSFDYVLCLSVIHHSLVNKDVWKVLVDRQNADDLQVLRAQLKALRGLTARGGKCIVEMPYEYGDPVEERKIVDFDILGKEMNGAGFISVRCLGTWEYNPEHVSVKDRIIYVAEA
jgi:SAM-dependent methyltransferase